ncbi:MAG: hypothetical protein RSB58_09230 [Clostridium sp.]
MDSNELIIELPIERKWYTCPCCGQRLLIYNEQNVAEYISAVKDAGEKQK